jgi:hypothetical protein
MSTQDFDQAVRVEIYRYFVDRGHAPVAAEVASALDAPVPEVEDAFRRLADAHVLVLAPGTPYIWMANPLSALPTPYAATVDSRSFWGNCIWDALGIVAMLGGTGEVESYCPDCGDPLSLRAADGELAESDHIVHYAVPARHWWDDIGFN